MRTRYKILLSAGAVAVLLVFVTIGLYFYSMAKLKNGLTYFHSQIVQGEGNVDSLDVDYGKIGFELPFGLNCSNVKLNILTAGSDQHLIISSGFVSSQLKGIPTGRLIISAKDVKIASVNKDKPLLSNQFKIRNIEVRFVEYETSVSVANPNQSMNRVYGHLAELLDGGDTTGALHMQGTVYFDFGKDQIIPQKFNTRQNGNLYRLVLDRKDLELVAPKFADRLSVGDLDLVANHPLKAPRLLEIRQETEEKSKELRWAIKDFPEDVYRHVLWSYLLTKEYGPQFAQIVTNSHEEGSFNSVEEMARDRQNNMVGVSYAENKIPESKIAERIRNDPRIQF
ncbi:MAG: hypothetical protein O3C43_21845 [Verrucomicrobia bacterium]|nr:hypothetical protein [Verrucomicrobiota bacterium]MDA1069138.1 hypothetical protein [Verrucomicrobiota bacterium]